MALDENAIRKERENQFARDYIWNSYYSNLKLKKKEENAMLEISEKNLKEILYHLNSFMELMRFGREYDKIVKLVKELPLAGRDLLEFYYVDKIVNPRIFKGEN